LGGLSIDCSARSPLSLEEGPSGRLVLVSWTEELGEASAGAASAGAASAEGGASRRESSGAKGGLSWGAGDGAIAIAVLIAKECAG